MISAFGPRAHRFAAGLGDINAVIADPPYIIHAYLEAASRRVNGQPFYGMVLFDDYRSALIPSVLNQVLAQQQDYDVRLSHMTAYANGTLPIDGKTSAEVWANIPEEIKALTPEFFALSNAMLVRSYTEATRWATILPRLRPIERVLVEPQVPEVTPSPGEPSVVVWAPEDPAPMLSYPMFALAEFPGSLTAICAGGTLTDLPDATFLPANDERVAEVLSRASVVVCPDLGDPGAAVALARRGFCIAAPTTSGAAEFIVDLATYDPAAPRSILDAVGIALGGYMRARDPLPPVPPMPVQPAAPMPREALPLATVVIITYNRPDDLERALMSIDNQTYPNLEMVVVNDAGQPVEEVVAKFPRARLYNQPQNSGVNAACIVGFSQARGEYFQLLADDDILYPDHVERLVVAMLRSGAAAAHANTVIRYQARADDGSYHTTGFNAKTFNDTTSATGALVTTPIAGQSIMVRRDAFEAVGGWTDRTFLSDQEFQLRLWSRYPVVWVDHMTSEWRVRPKGSNFSTTVNSSSELENVYAMHPIEGRPMLQSTREATVKNVASWPVGFVFPPTIRINPS